MRLLNLYTQDFAEFYGGDTPPYAILSHRWRKHEIPYADFANETSLQGQGYDKILGFCELARQRRVRIWDEQRLNFCEVGVEWGWVDTCCIDKGSSAELSEAINSMFEWYNRSAVCYVYLDDVPPSRSGEAMQQRAFDESEWFTRGWTLQELLAPWDVLFCNSAWEVVGHKCTHTDGGRPLPCTEKGHSDIYGPRLNAQLTRITDIAASFLISPLRMFDASIACRMSWAASRRTTRKEDIAYCLLGIFEVQIPLLYGEGDRAFLRLQEELVRRSNDQSIFDWDGWTEQHAMFTFDPTAFAGSSDVVTTGRSPDSPYTVTHNGLEMHAKSRKVYDKDWSADAYFITLNCGRFRNVPVVDGEERRVERCFVPTVIKIASLNPANPHQYDRVRSEGSEMLWYPHVGEAVDDKLFYIRAWEVLARKTHVTRSHIKARSEYVSMLHGGPRAEEDEHAERSCARQIGGGDR